MYFRKTTPRIVLEGLDGSGKTARGNRLSELLGIKFIEFPREAPRRYVGAEFEVACYEDRLAAIRDIREPYIAGRWSPSGIAYARNRASAYLRERHVPSGDLCVFVDTPRNIRLQRISLRSTLDTFETTGMQDYAEAGYREMLASGSWSPLIVDGLDLEKDVEIILEALDTLSCR
jgi:thymidylate kinase